MRGRSRCTSLGLLALLVTGCVISRTYVGATLPADDLIVLQEGQSTKGEVLRLLGPPTQILPQTDGDAFVYRYVRKNESSLTIEEPIITNLTIFGWSKEQEKEDRLIVLFDRSGVVLGWGLRRGTAELEPL